MGDNPHYSSLVPPPIPSTRLVILWGFLMGNPIFLWVFKNLASPSRSPILFTSLSTFNPLSLPPWPHVNCHCLPGQKSIPITSPRKNSHCHYLSIYIAITVTFSVTCFLIIPSSLPRLLILSIHNASRRQFFLTHFLPFLSQKSLARFNRPLSFSSPHPH